MTIHFLFGFASSLLLVGVCLQVALRMNVLAHPNVRSSHEVPTPAIGGIGIVVPVVITLSIAAYYGSSSAAAIAAAGSLIALLGFWDDLSDLPALARLLVQTAAVILMNYYLLNNVTLVVFFAISFITLWHVNLFNFMDGIDGIAAVQVLLFVIGILTLNAEISGWISNLCLVLAGACLGFLVYNWPPALIFMGDVASGFLGLVVSGVSIALHTFEVIPLSVSLILLAGFWIDASYTLLVRILTGQRFFSPHRSHLYQKISIRVGHRWTTIGYLCHGTFWLLPVAWLAESFPGQMLIWWTLTVLPGAILCIYFRAGFADAVPKPDI